MSTRTSKARALQPADYLKKILTARVYDVATESALEVAKNLSRRIHNTVLLKREDQQPVHSFKLRGAYNKMAHLSPEQLKKGVICASAGNHAQGVALAAKKLGIKATIFMPVGASLPKFEATKNYGADVVLSGAVFAETLVAAREYANKKGAIFIPPYDNLDVILGQGTVGLELLDQVPDVKNVIVAILSLIHI